MFSSDQRALMAYHGRNAPSASLFRAAARANERLHVNRFNAMANRVRLNRRLASATVRGIRGYPRDFGRRYGEKKVIDTANANYACDTTGTVTCLNPCSQGTSSITRIGDKIVVKQVQVRGEVHPVDAATADSLCRVIVVQDMQPNGAGVAAITDILKSANANSFNNLDNRRRFKILKDAKMAVGMRANGDTNSPNVYPIDMFIKCNIPTIYGGNAGTAADIQENSIYLVTVGSQATGLGGQLSATCRVRFTDD